MCLAIPMKVVSISGQEAVVEQSGVTRRARLDLVPNAAVGDYVLIHAGFAIATVSEEDARDNLSLLQELGL